MQIQLPFKTSAPEVTPEEIDRLVDFLRGRGWVTARRIKDEIGLDDRRVRAIAEHSQGRILSGPGCPGFGKDALPDAEHAIDCFESQARKMLQRATAYRQRYHRFARP